MSYFVVEVRTGKEIQAKEMIKHLLKKSTSEETNLIHAVHALHNCTTYLKSNADQSTQLDEEDSYNQIVAESIVNLLGNLKKQYEEIKGRTDGKSSQEKVGIKEEISKLEKELRELRKDSKKMKAILPGYILIELKTDIDYLPTALWNLIKECPLVRSIPSRFSIPEEELTWLFDSETTEAQVEVQFETVMEEDEIEKRESELLHKANTASDLQEEKKYLEKSENVKNNLVSEINELKDSSNSMMTRVKAFIKNKKETISMPVSLFFELYNECKEKVVLLTISSTDFLSRLRRLLKAHGDMVALE